MKKILVIDDDPQERDALRKILELDGHHIDEADEGSSGFELYKSVRHDLVITDIVMPGTEGIETIFLLMQEFPEVKIIAVSEGGYLGATENYLTSATVIGAKRVFEKPVDPAALIEAVSQLLDNTDSSSQLQAPLSNSETTGIDEGTI